MGSGRGVGGRRGNEEENDTSEVVYDYFGVLFFFSAALLVEIADDVCTVCTIGKSGDGQQQLRNTLKFAFSSGS